MYRILVESFTDSRSFSLALWGIKFLRMCSLLSEHSETITAIQGTLFASLNMEVDVKITLYL